MWVNQQPSNIPPAEQTLPIPEPLPETLPQGQVNKKKTPSDDWEGKSHPVRRRKDSATQDCLMLAAAYLSGTALAGVRASSAIGGYPAADLLPDLLAKVVCSTGQRRRGWIVFGRVSYGGRRIDSRIASWLICIGAAACVFVCDLIWYWYRSDQRAAVWRISTAAVACLSSIRRYPGGDCRWMSVLIWNFCVAGMLTAAQRLFRRKNPRTNSGECKGIGRTIFVVCSSICTVVRCGNRAFMPAQSTGIVIFKKRRKNNR